jgi:hypothetical protein
MYIYKRLQSFLEKENLPGLKTISEKIEENLNIYLKLFVLLYADDTVIISPCLTPISQKK